MSKNDKEEKHKKSLKLSRKKENKKDLVVTTLVKL